MPRQLNSYKGATRFQIWTMTFFLSSCIGMPMKRDQLQSGAKLPEADGRFHIYVLPIGLGDAHVIQCPDGALSIYDWGSTNARNDRFWGREELQRYLFDDFDRVLHVIVSHNHYDHVRFLTEVDGMKALTNLKQIHISCTKAEMHELVSDWVESVDGYEGKLRVFNDGQMCGPKGGPCGDIDLCPGDGKVTAKVLAANLGGCNGVDVNSDSIVIKVVVADQVSVLLAGDLEDLGDNPDEDGPLKWMTDFYGDQLRSTVYQVAHHGASGDTNKPAWAQAVAPRAVWSSGDPWFSDHSPSCAALDVFLDSLCRPLETDPESDVYCGGAQEEDPGLTGEEILQDIYTCLDPETGSRVTRTGNQYGIYVPTQDSETMNLLTFSTDGQTWGFVVTHICLTSTGEETLSQMCLC